MTPAPATTAGNITAKRNFSRDSRVGELRAARVRLYSA